MMTTCEFLHIKYTVALFSALEVLVRKKQKTCDLHDFLGILHVCSIGLVQAVSESLQELVRASSSSMLVTLNNV